MGSLPGFVVCHLAPAYHSSSFIHQAVACCKQLERPLWDLNSFRHREDFHVCCPAVQFPPFFMGEGQEEAGGGAGLF